MRGDTLALTREHVFWADGNGRVYALQTSVADAEPVVVSGSLEVRWLRPDPESESVVVDPAPDATDPRPRRITANGVETVFAVEDTPDPHMTVPISGGRVVRIDLDRAGTTSCSPGVLGYGRGCGTEWHWSQVVLYELSEDSVAELGHIDFDGGPFVGLIEAGGAATVLQDAQYVVPTI